MVEILSAALLGAFLGLRREMDAQESKKHVSFMGLRTMSLLAVLGTFSTQFPNWTALPLVFFASIAILVAIAYAHGSFQLNRIGLTTELSALMTFWIGVLIGYQQQTFAILLTLFLASLNAFKDPMHAFVKTLTHKEWLGALELLALSGAILPFLPQEPIDPWGVFIPFNVWLLVILISGIEFVGYFLVKYFGVRGGVPLTAFLGSIVSSTAVTIGLSDQATRSKLKNVFVGGILLATATMQVRVAGEILLLGPQYFYKFLIVPIIMAVVSSLAGIYFFIRSDKSPHEISMESQRGKIKSPFEIFPSLKFGLIFVIILFALVLGQRYLGHVGVYGAAVLSGVIDIDAIVLSSLESLSLGEVSSHVAQGAITAALFTNTIVKIIYVAILGTRQLVMKLIPPILLVVGIGATVFWLT